MTTDATTLGGGDDRLLETLQRLLQIHESDLRSALTAACTLLSEVLQSEKVDLFLYEAESDSLVALGTSDTPMGRSQIELGLHRLPIANDGPAVTVFQMGRPYLTGAADQDPTALPGVVEGLGVRSEMTVVIDVNGERRGVLQIDSSEYDRFNERDLRFLTAAAGWMGMLTHRAELVEETKREAVLRGRREAGDELARLTRRQQEVAACVAEGLSNDDIARRLVPTPGTAANHVAQIMRRLGFTSRTQIAVWAVERGLYRSDTEAYLSG